MTVRPYRSFWVRSIVAIDFDQMIAEWKSHLVGHKVGRTAVIRSDRWQPEGHRLRNGQFKFVGAMRREIAIAGAYQPRDFASFHRMAQDHAAGIAFDQLIEIR